MDLEEYILRNLKKDKDVLINNLKEIIKQYKGKNWDEKTVELFANELYKEVTISKSYKKESSWLLDYPKSNVKAGEIGLGSRGAGDFFVHELYKKIILHKDTSIDKFDDAGYTKILDNYLVVSIDGMHSRLSEFPFIAGFHATRAAARDVMVKGAIPLGFLVDVRVGDDADVLKLYDFMLGVSLVVEYCSSKILAGSTLRIGGDVVFGTRLIGTVGCIGLTKRFIPKASVQEKDILLLTEGSGGGTISTIAIYNGYHDVVLETINMDFYNVCKIVVEHFSKYIHAMTDVTNGGIRKDADEIATYSNKKLVFYYDELEKSVNKKVLRMLRDLGIDFLGISLDSILISVPENYVEDVKRELSRITNVYEVGYVDKGKGVKLIVDGREKDLTIKFREEPYTRVKKVIGDSFPRDYDEMRKRVLKAIEKLMEKKNRIKKILNEKAR